jgi:Family of unknown function (DUF6152)
MMPPTKETKMKFVCGLAAAGLAFSTPAFAHHSGAMFDANQIVTLDGTVKEFQWTNPHSWLQMVVPDGKGGSKEWSLELVSLNVLSHNGWKPGTLKPGDKVQITMHPLKNGDPGGMGVGVTWPDGKQMKLNGGTTGADGSAAAPN